MKVAFLLIVVSLNVLAFDKVPQLRPGLYGSLKNVKCPIEIIPSQAIGPLRKGMTFKEVEALEMDIKEVPAMKDHFIVGKYSIWVKDQVVSMVEAEFRDLPDCVKFENKRISTNISPESLSKIFKGCGESQIKLGGNNIDCEGISIMTGGFGGEKKTPQVKIQ
jgi:hypothetical protein